MGIDRDKFVDVPCPCGAGRIEITDYSDDHSFAKSCAPWKRERAIGCEKCERRYDFLTTRTGNIWLVDRHTKRKVKLLYDACEDRRRFEEGMRRLGDSRQAQTTKRAPTRTK